MAVASKLRSIVDQIQAEHEQLEEMFALIHQMFGGGTKNVPELRNMLPELSTRVEEHLAHEEEGGYFNEIIENFPQYSRPVAELLQEHAEILASSRQLAVNAREAPDSLTWWQAIRLDFNDFARQFIAHERHENNLIQEAYTQDLGSQD